MKSEKISSGLILGAVLLSLSLALPLPGKAADCVLTPQTAYKTKTSPAVYYITRSCTKRPFVNEISFFAYFSSWKEVKIVADEILYNTPDDSRGQMRIVGEVKPAPTKITKEPAVEINPIRPEPITAVPTAPTPTPAPVFRNIISEFLDCPTITLRNKFEQDFTIIWNKDWDIYPFVCETKTTQPSRLAIYNTLDLLKNINFTKPLPFTHGLSLYEYLTVKKLSLYPQQNCAQYSTGWNYQINLSGTFAHMHPVKSGSAACEAQISPGADLLDGFVYNPLYKAGVFVHEAQHAIDGSTHTGINGGDKNINDNSAWAAQFYFYAWVNLYSINIDATTKLLAKNEAASVLNSRFSKNKCPSDADLKKVVNTIAPNTCL